MNPVRKYAGRALVGAAAIVAFALVGPSLSVAEETQQDAEIAVTTEEKICEAQQRTEARWQKWINEGVPEEFGSEEPFTFDPESC